MRPRTCTASAAASAAAAALLLALAGCGERRDAAVGGHQPVAPVQLSRVAERTAVGGTAATFLDPAGASAAPRLDQRALAERSAATPYAAVAESTRFSFGLFTSHEAQRNGKDLFDHRPAVVVEYHFHGCRPSGPAPSTADPKAVAAPTEDQECIAWVVLDADTGQELLTIEV